MNIIKIFKDSEFCILDVFLDYLKVKHTREFTTKFYNEHPHKFNLYGLSLMLTEYSIKNMGLRFKDKNYIAKVNSPFIAHLMNDKFVVVYNIGINEVDYINDGEQISTSIDEFYNICSGTILMAEPSKESAEPNYSENRQNELIHSSKCFTSLTCVLIIMLITSSHYFSYSNILVSLAINLLGSYIGYLLLLKQMKVQSNIAEKMCSLFKQSNCNNVLESDAAHFLGVFSWSELGFSYFVSNTIIILLFPKLVSFLVILNLCTLPYSIWSVWYQMFKVKKWCPICLIVISLFWIQFIMNILFSNLELPSFDLFDILLLGSIYVLIYTATSMSVLKFSEYKKADLLNYSINNLKINEDVFDTLLKKQPYYKVDKSTSNILFGNPDSKTLITVITNPLCVSCFRMHPRIDKFLKNTANKICVQYIFISFKSQEIYTRFLIATYLRNERNEALNIYNKWFSNGVYNTNEFMHQYDYNTDDELVNSECVFHDEWAKDAELNATPTILVNGYKLPEAYKIEDLFLLDI